MAKRETWKRKIKKWCQDAGTYQQYFSGTIDTLARIMERRDMAIRQFEESGGELTVEHTNKSGATNLEKNPAYAIVRECEQDALAYWRDLGLTPAGLKKINEQAMKKPKRNALAEALRDLGG